MIVDGAGVLYTMRNGKIVDPNIPMDGLVCYLDTRGKYNTDVYRNTLLDLSGNGNNGTLQNFAFTEKSGYINDLSGGGTSGLKFDGVDDAVSTPLRNISNKEITIYIKDLEMNRINNRWIWVLSKNTHRGATTTGFGLGTFAIDGTLVFYSNGIQQRLISEVAGKPIKASTIVVTIKPGIQKFYVNGQLINTTNIENRYVDNGIAIHIGKATHLGDPVSNIKIGRVGIWNRALTDTEITQLMEA